MSSSQGKENFARFAHLTFGICPRAVRTYFDSLSEFAPYNLGNNIRQNKANIDKLITQKRINNEQKKLLFVNSGNPDSSSFDITLMVCLIRNLTNIKSPVNGFDKLPLPGEITPASDLARIKYYRNFIAHHGKDEIDSNVFQSAWCEVTNAVDRLSNGLLLHECNDLKTKTLDQSNLSILTEVINIFPEIKELKKTVSDLKEGPVRSLIAATKDMMDGKNMELYSPLARVEDKAFQLLSNQRIVVLSGIEGSGKTTLAFHLMKRLVDSNCGIDNCFIPVEVIEPTDLRTLLDKACTSNSYVILMDDPFGKSNFGSNKLDDWEKYFQRLKKKIDEGALHLIITTRYDIFLECNHVFHTYHWLETSLLNMSSEEWVPDSTEKWHMLRAFCDRLNIYMQYDTLDELKVKETESGEVPSLISDNLIDKIRKTNPSIGFPQSCFLFFSNAHIFKTGLSFFKNARQGLKNEISFLYSRSEYTKKIYATLVWMLFRGGQMELETISNNSEIHEELKTQLSIRFDKTDVKNILKHEDKYFRLKDSNNDNYCFSHETILESILISFCDESERQELLLKLAVDNIVLEFIRSSGYKPKNGEVCIQLDKSLDEKLLDKLIEICPEDKIFTYYFNDNAPPEMNIVKHKTFQDQRMSYLLLKRVLERNIINSQCRLEQFFMDICVQGHLPLLEEILKIYGPENNSSGFTLGQINIRLCLKNIITFTDNDLILQRLIEYDPNLLNLKIDSNETRTSHITVNGGVKCLIPMISYAIGSITQKKCVNVMLNNGVDLKVYDEKKNNPLHYCVRRWWKDVIEEMIEREPQLLTEVNNQGHTPLLKAAYHGMRENVEFLLNYQNDMLLEDFDGNNILHLCVKCWAWPTIIDKVMELEKGVLNIKNKEGKSPIMVAKDVKTFEAVLKHCPDLSIRDKEESTVLHCIISFLEDETILQRLAETHPPLLNAQNVNGQTPILLAVKHINRNTISSLLKIGADIDIQDNENNNILHYCAKYNLPEIALIVLGRKLEFLNSVNCYDRTALMEAASNGHLEFCKALLQFSPDLAVVDNAGNNILHYCRSNLEDICINIMGQKSDLLYQKNNNDCTPIMTAVQRGYANIVKVMLNRDEDLKYINQAKRYTLLHFAACKGTPEVCEVIIAIDYKLLVQREADSLMTPLMLAACRCNDETFGFLITKSEDSGCSDRDLNTIFHLCARNILLETNFKRRNRESVWYTSCIRTLQNDNTIICNEAVGMGTPIVYALTRGRFNLNVLPKDLVGIHLMSWTMNRWCELFSLMKEMVKTGSNFSDRDKEGCNILHLISCPYLHTGYEFCNIAEVIIDYTIEVNPNLLNERNSHGCTPLLFAAKRKSYNFTYLLLRHSPDTSVEDHDGVSFRKLIKTDRLLLVSWISSMIFLFHFYSYRYRVLMSLVDLYCLYKQS